MVLLIIIIVTGITGLFYIEKIRGKVDMLSEEAYPLSKYSNYIIRDIQELNITASNVLSLENMEDIVSEIASIDYMIKDFEDKFKQLEALIKEHEMQQTIQPIKEIWKKFFNNMNLAIETHKIELNKSNMVNSSFDLINNS